MEYIVSVAKTYKHRGNHQHNQAKKHWFVYYYDNKDAVWDCYNNNKDIFNKLTFFISNLLIR